MVPRGDLGATPASLLVGVFWGKEEEEEKASEIFLLQLAVTAPVLMRQSTVALRRTSHIFYVPSYRTRQVCLQLCSARSFSMHSPLVSALKVALTSGSWGVFRFLGTVSGTDHLQVYSSCGKTYCRSLGNESGTDFWKVQNLLGFRHRK